MANIDFSKGPVWKCILAQATPLMLAQMVQLLYNVVDRVYLGHLGEENSLALTGVGLIFPVVTLITAFSVLFGNGGVPLFSIERGAGNKEKAERIMGNSFALLLCSALVLTVGGYVFSKPMLFAFGASTDSYVFADAYLDVYLAGTVFAMISTGMNGYISAQGFPKTGMFSVVIGAVTNILLDPVFIFYLDMGVAGAALATVISQAVSAIWILCFLFSRKPVISLSSRNIRIEKKIAKDISKLGTTNFVMSATSCLVQVAGNAVLQSYGGDLFIGVMTVINSVREVFSLPTNGLTGGVQPVISYNYGAKDYERVKNGIRFNTAIGVLYTLVAWLAIVTMPRLWFRVFTDDPLLLESGVKMLKVYFFGFVFISLQFSGQSVFQALGDARHAIFFSLLRKAFIVVPMTLLLPAVGFGAMGVFMAEPISNIIGGIACYTTMRLTIYKKLDQEHKENRSITYGIESESHDHGNA